MAGEAHGSVCPGGHDGYPVIRCGIQVLDIVTQFLLIDRYCGALDHLNPIRVVATVSTM